MNYTCGTEIRRGDVVAQLWWEKNNERYLATVTEIGHRVTVRDNWPEIHNEGIIGNLKNIKFLRRKGDVRVGDEVWLTKDEGAAPKDTRVVVDQVTDNSIYYIFPLAGCQPDTPWSAENYVLASVSENTSAAIIDPTKCACGGPARPTGFGTLVFDVCISCKKEKP